MPQPRHFCSVEHFSNQLCTGAGKSHQANITLVYPHCVCVSPSGLKDSSGSSTQCRAEVPSAARPPPCLLGSALWGSHRLIDLIRIRGLLLRLMFTLFSSTSRLPAPRRRTRTRNAHMSWSLVRWPPPAYSCTPLLDPFYVVLKAAI